MHDVSERWKNTISQLEKEFNQEMTLKGVWYLIGVQELNRGLKKYAREDKLGVLHVAVCKILVPFGYYQFERVDEDGWPHYTELKAIKDLSENDQELLIKKAIMQYLN